MNIPRQMHNESQKVPTVRLFETKPTEHRWSGGWQPPGEIAGGPGTAAPREMQKLTRAIFETCKHENQTMLNNSIATYRIFVTEHKHRIRAVIAKHPRCKQVLVLSETIVFNNT